MPPPSPSLRLRALLGGGKVADVLLWRDRLWSVAVLAGATAVWFLFEVAQYHLVTLLCHLAIFAMLAVFVWSNLAPLFDRNPPRIPETLVSERALREAASVLYAKFTDCLRVLHAIACGKDVKLFLTVVASLWIISVIGGSFSFMSLVYLGLLSGFSIPALYERYQAEVDHLAMRGGEGLKKFLNKIDSKLEMIPRGPVKTSKIM